MRFSTQSAATGAAILVALTLTLDAQPRTAPPSRPTGARVAQLESAGVSPRNANYSIDARLDPSSRTITGREVLTWRNISAIATAELQFHLYYNAWRNSQSTWLRE